MIDEIVRQNNGTCYTNAIYEKTQKILLRRKEEIDLERKIDMERKRKEYIIEQRFKNREKQNLEKEKEFKKIQDQYNQLPNSMDEVKNEVENKNLLTRFVPQIFGAVVPVFFSCLRSIAF